MVDVPVVQVEHCFSCFEAGLGGGDELCDEGQEQGVVGLADQAFHVLQLVVELFLDVEFHLVGD